MRWIFPWMLAATLTGLLSFASAQSTAPVQQAKPVAPYWVATFDSGFGGYLTAKEIEKQAQSLIADGYGPFRITHYGDTLHAPYGEKTPEQIATYSAAGILTAFRDGAKEVYVACNTASTQIDRIRELLRLQDPAYPNHVHSILDVSVREVMKTVGAKLRLQDTVNVAILATPATVKSENYPRLLAKALGVPPVPGTLTTLPQPRWLTSKGVQIDSFAYSVELALGPRKRVVIAQFAPANWVEMIENAAPDADKQEAVHRDLALLFSQAKPGTRFAVIGEFCTHYPVFDPLIQQTLRGLGCTQEDTAFVVQGPLMASLFRTNFLKQRPAKAAGPAQAPAPPAFCMTGSNVEAIRDLIQAVYPGGPEPVIEHREFPLSP